eukprot:gene9829-35_t
MPINVSSQGLDGDWVGMCLRPRAYRAFTRRLTLDRPMVGNPPDPAAWTLPVPHAQTTTTALYTTYPLRARQPVPAVHSDAVPGRLRAAQKMTLTRDGHLDFQEVGVKVKKPTHFALGWKVHSDGAITFRTGKQ